MNKVLVRCPRCDGFMPRGEPCPHCDGLSLAARRVVIGARVTTRAAGVVISAAHGRIRKARGVVASVMVKRMKYGGA